jgi:predicted Zn-dependent protease with MMP-like domain
MPIRLSKSEFSKLVDQALSLLPPEFLEYMDNVSVEIQPRAPRKLLAELEMDPDQDELLGYYDGVPLTEKSVSAPYEMPERIFIYQRSIEEICDTPEDVVEEVRLTVLHEVGHHFGMGEDELRRYGYE